MPEILSKKELKELTGTATLNNQKNVLTKNGINFVLDWKGNVKTTWDAVNLILTPPAQAQQETEETPDLKFLDG